MTSEEILNSDNAALQKFIDFYDFYAQDKMMGLIDLNFKPMTLSPATLKAIQHVLPCITREEIMQNSLVKLFAPFTEWNQPQHGRHQKFIAARDKLQSVQWFVYSRNRNDEFRLTKTNLVPLLNPVTKNLIAIEMTLETVDSINSVFVMQGLPQLSLNLETNSEYLRFGLNENLLNITKLQHEVLFMLFHDYHMKQIQDVLERIYSKRRSLNSIYQIIAFIKDKYELNNTIELLELIKKHNYHVQIPEALLDNFFIDGLAS